MTSPPSGPQTAADASQAAVPVGPHDALVERVRDQLAALHPREELCLDDVAAVCAANVTLERELQEARAEVEKAETDADSILESWKRACEERDYASGQLQEARRLNDDFREALLKICQWADAYPLDVFPEPDWKRAREALESAGMTLDSVSASNMRHVVTGVGKIARAALRDG